MNEWLALPSPHHHQSLYEAIYLSSEGTFGAGLRRWGQRKKRQGGLRGSWLSLSLGTRSDPAKMRAVGSFHEQLCGSQFRAELRWQSRTRSWSEKQFSSLKGIQLCFEHCWRLKLKQLHLEQKEVTTEGWIEKSEGSDRGVRKRENQGHPPVQVRASGDGDAGCHLPSWGIQEEFR